MKAERIAKKGLLILFIILISLISFGGIYVQKTKFVENILPNYQLGMDLKGGRMVGLAVSQATNKTIYDKDGNVVEEEGKETTTKEEPINPTESLTTENYLAAKEILEKRLNEMNVSNYTIRLNEKTGKFIIMLPENSNTDNIAQYMSMRGAFTVTNEDGELLLDNRYVESAQVGYSTGTTGTTVYLTIQFNEEGTDALKAISNIYVESTDSEGNDTTKEVIFKMDDTTILQTYFAEEISTGMIRFSIGSASTSSNELNQYAKEASNLAVLLNSGALPLTYKIEENRYVMSDITEEMFFIPMIVALSSLAIGIIVLIIKYRKNGFLSAISLIGYIAVLLLVVRYANVILTLEGIAGIAFTILLNYIFTVYLLHLLKHEKDIKTKEEVKNKFNEALVKSLFILIPSTIAAVILCFAGWLPVYSFGMVVFWGILLIALYNVIFTRNLIELSIKNK